LGKWFTGLEYPRWNKVAVDLEWEKSRPLKFPYATAVLMLVWAMLASV
jgi:hypothetical protein